MTAVRAIYLYKPRTQGMAAEMRTWHDGVADPHLREGGSGTAEWATEVRMPDSLSDAKMVNKAALDCPDAPLGRHKVGETCTFLI